MGKQFKIPFPLSGENRSNPQSEQPGQTVVNLQNVRPYDTSELRLRGGQRPGLKKWGAGTAMGSRIVSMVSVSYMDNNKNETYT